MNSSGSPKNRLTPAVFVFASGLLAMAVAAHGATNPRGRRGGAFPSTVEPAPAPTNLKVMPKSLTGVQIRVIMEQWSAELGVRCDACHVQESDGVVRGGAPQTRYADDSKAMEKAARLMYTMTVEINRRYIVGDDAVPGPVTCGTCHRGRVEPQPFVPAKDAQPFQSQDSNLGVPRLRH